MVSVPVDDDFPLAYAIATRLEEVFPNLSANAVTNVMKGMIVLYKSRNDNDRVEAIKLSAKFDDNHRCYLFYKGEEIPYVFVFEPIQGIFYPYSHDMYK